MDYDLPEFDLKLAKRSALPFANQIFGQLLKHLKIEDDGRCRAIFAKSYFVLQEGNTEASKSQWSTLKKKFKRRNHGVFVFKETGEIPCQSEAKESCYFIDFGFFKD
jgi:hypothetical protein